MGTKVISISLSCFGSLRFVFTQPGLFFEGIRFVFHFRPIANVPSAHNVDFLVASGPSKLKIKASDNNIDT